MKEPVRGKRSFKVGLAAEAGGEIGPDVHAGPFVALAEGDGGDAGSLEAFTSARNSVQVVGGAVMPALANRALLYQKPIMPISHGTP